MPLKVQEITEQLNVRQWGKLCGAVDQKHGNATKFQVVSIKREEQKVTVVVCTDSGILHTVELAA